MQSFKTLRIWIHSTQLFPIITSLSYLFLFRPPASLWLLLVLSLPAAAPPAVLKSTTEAFIMRVTLRGKLGDHVVLAPGERNRATPDICGGKSCAQRWWMFGGCELTLCHSRAVGWHASSPPPGRTVLPPSSPCPPPLHQRQLSPPLLSANTLRLQTG